MPGTGQSDLVSVGKRRKAVIPCVRDTRCLKFQGGRSQEMNDTLYQILSRLQFRRSEQVPRMIGGAQVGQRGPYQQRVHSTAEYNRAAIAQEPMQPSNDKPNTTRTDAEAR
jgi:hypothetical protein